MTLYRPDVLASINASLHTEEDDFLAGAINSFTCMGGPNYNHGTTKILDSIAETYGYREVFRFLYSIKKIRYQNLRQAIDYKYFWDWFKNCHENLSVFRQEVEECASKIDGSKFASVIPESIRKEFD